MKGVNGIAIAWLSSTDLTNLNSGEGGSNLVDVKKFKYHGEEYPYVSGQAMRAYLKEAIRRDLQVGEYMCVPNAKGETCGDAKRCIQCDLFGYMIPKKKAKGTEKRKGEVPDDETSTEGGALTRVSPVKVAPAIGQFQFNENSTLDFLTRRKPQEKSEERSGDIVNVELGKNFYKAGVDIDVLHVGQTEEIDTKERSVSLRPFITGDEIASRTKKVLEAIRFMSDYSKQARLLTDFTPDIICITFQKRYSHRLQKLFEFNGDEGPNAARMSDILADVKSYSSEIYFGLTRGVLSQSREDLVVKTVEESGVKVVRPEDALRSALNAID